MNIVEHYTTTSLYDSQGSRKYLTSGERKRFLCAASQCEARTRALCRVLAFSGCRISEALGLTRTRLDVETGRIVLCTLKRRKLMFRAVPVPAALIAELAALPIVADAPDRLWTWCRQTAWRRIKGVMACACITGAQAMPKGLRHGFGIAAAEENIPPGLTKRWMGHARLETTILYQDAVGPEERSFAKRLWR